jgi:hypothetical protein
MISVISVINNETIAREFLLRGLSRQDSKFELLLVDNKTSTYKSASQAYNLAGIKAKGDYLMFVHQDVLLLSRNWLKKAEEWLSTRSRVGLAGVAGMMKPKFANQIEVCARYYLLAELGKLYVWYQRYGRGNVLHGFETETALPWGGRFISNVASVQTVDELVLIVPTRVFESVRFDEVVCDYWHFYGVDFALTASQKGYEVCVLPCSVLHHSHTSIAIRASNLRKVIKKHKQEKIINSTYGLLATKEELMELFWVANSNKVANVITALAIK